MGSHKLHRLTALSVKKINTPGKYGDGHGLYLIVDSSGAKRWEQRLTVQGRRNGKRLLPDIMSRGSGTKKRAHPK